MKREFLQGLQVGDMPLTKEVIDAIIESGGTEAFVRVDSRFDRPRPLSLPMEGEERSIMG